MVCRKRSVRFKFDLLVGVVTCCDPVQVEIQWAEVAELKSFISGGVDDMLWALLLLTGFTANFLILKLRKKLGSPDDFLLCWCHEKMHYFCFQHTLWGTIRAIGNFKMGGN